MLTVAYKNMQFLLIVVLSTVSIGSIGYFAYKCFNYPPQTPRGGPIPSPDVKLSRVPRSYDLRTLDPGSNPGS